MAETHDREAALERLGGDEELLQEITRIFLRIYPHIVSDLRAALAGNDIILAERAAHSLKGSASELSAGDVAQDASRLEALAREGKLTAAPSALLRLEQDLIALDGALRHDACDVKDAEKR